jgi:hypothetical protein
MYTKRIHRDAPAALILLIDRSGSMTEQTMFNGEYIPKSEAVAIATNLLLREIINICRREDGVRDYFDIAVIGYGDGKAEPLTAGRDGFTTPSRLAAADCPTRLFMRERVMPDTGKTMMTSDRLRYWIEPAASGNTPMLAALEMAYELARGWCGKAGNRASFPPVVINITDGEASDGNREMLCDTASRIKSLSTEDGNALLVNINISTGGRSVIFPSDMQELPPSRYNEMLYEMSSVMPAAYDKAILSLKGAEHKPPFRGLGINTSMPVLIEMLNIGTTSINHFA